VKVPAREEGWMVEIAFDSGPFGGPMRAIVPLAGASSSP
jgi:hypothetical protein